MANNSTFTAPLAVIQINNQTIGKIRSLSFTENIQRGEVMGIGKITLQEVPILSIRCSFQADSYHISLNKLGTIPDPFWPVNATDPELFLRSILLGEVPVQIQVYRRVATSESLQSNGQYLIPSEGLKLVGTADECYIDSKSWNIQEGNVSGKNLSGRYLTPMWNLG